MMSENGSKKQPSTVTKGRGRKAPPRHFTPDELAFIRHYAEQGYSAAAIGEALGRTGTVVSERIRRDGIEYTPAPPGTYGRRIGPSPRIFDGPASSRTSAEKVQEIVSAGRRNTTLADVAREACVDPQTAERVLQHHAPTVWRWQIRGGIVPVGKIIANVAGDWTRHGEALRENGLRQPRDYDTLIVDYGVDEAWHWLERLEADHHALRNLRRELRNALQRAEEAEGREDDRR